jgi:hypothetical protein
LVNDVSENREGAGQAVAMQTSSVFKPQRYNIFLKRKNKNDKKAGWDAILSLLDGF